jgi:hypothetical protein
MSITVKWLPIINFISLENNSFLLKMRIFLLSDISYADISSFSVTDRETLFMSDTNQSKSRSPDQPTFFHLNHRFQSMFNEHDTARPR